MSTMVNQHRKIEHDKDKKQITYNNFSKIYDKTILFPKFFHPDPTV